MTTSDDYLRTVERLEPDVTPVDLAGAQASIAISMKRIADTLHRIAMGFAILFVGLGLTLFVCGIAALFAIFEAEDRLMGIGQ